MDNPDQIEQMSGKYVAAAQANTLSKSIEAIEKVYEQVIAEHNAKGKESVS